jgi:copper(I)-binding protein
MRPIKNLLALFALLLAGSAWAQTVKVDDAWARAASPGQTATGAFMTLTAPEGAQLVGVSSPAAGVAEVHEMKMEDGVMKMRAVAALDLPAGKPVELKPGGYHVMLMDLKAPLAPGSAVPLTLVLRDAHGAEARQELHVPVRALAAPADHDHMPMKH